MKQAAQAAPSRSRAALKLSGWLAVTCLVVPLLSAGLYLYWLYDSGMADGTGMVGLFFLAGTAVIEVPLLLAAGTMLVIGVVNAPRSRRTAESAPGSIGNTP